MKPIISPFKIYLLGIIPELKIFFLCVGIIGLAILGIGFLIWHLDCCCTDEELLEAWGKIKKYVVVLTMSSLLGMILPSQDTLTAMVVSNYVTPDNIEILGDTAKDTVDYIFEKIDETKEKE